MSIRRHTLANLVGTLIPLAVTILTVPWYLAALGEARYGVLAIVWLVLGYFAFLDLGLGKATANGVAAAQHSAEERSLVLRSALTANIIIGTAVGTVAWVTGRCLSHRLGTSALHHEVAQTLPWMAASIPLLLVSSVLTGALEGCRRFGVVNALQIVGTLAFQLIPLAAATMFGGTLDIVIPAAVISRALTVVPFFVACVVLVPMRRGLPASFAKIRRLMAYGGWVAVTGIVGPVLETIDRILIGATLGSRAVAHYSLVYQLVTKARILPGSLMRAAFPTLSASSAEEGRLLVVRVLSSLARVMTPLVLCGIFLLHPVMSLWVGQSLATSASRYGEIMLIGVWAGGMAQLPYAYTQAIGRPGTVARLHLYEVGPFLVSLYLAVHWFGLTGAAAAWTIRCVLDALLQYWAAELPLRYLLSLLRPAIVVGLCGFAAYELTEIEWGWRLLALGFALFASYECRSRQAQVTP